MLVLKNISRTYKTRKGVKVKALDDISLKLEHKGMVFILGKSGSGKSTFLNVVGGLDKYDSGELIVKDKSTLKFNQNDFDSYRNTMIGFIFQEYNVLDDFTVAQNIGLALELQGIKATNESINDILEKVDLVGYGKRKPNELSGGQKQRIAIARALVKNPEVIMADEPTGALDSETSKQILDTLKKLSETRLVIVVSHDREFAFNYGDRIIEFMDGKIISDVLREKTLENSKDKIFIEDDKLVLMGGYKLTELDLRLINDYLINNKKNLIVDKRNKDTKFVNTDESKFVLKEEVYKPIKSKLPFKSSLKIGASSLKFKKVRLFISILLASISFALFGLSDTMASYNKVRALRESLEESNITMYSINKVKNLQTKYGVNKRDVGMFQNEIDLLNAKYSNANFIGIFKSENDYLYFNNSLYDQITPLNQIVYQTNFQGFIELDNNILTNSPFVLLKGRVPSLNNEVVVSKHTYNYFNKFGYRDLLTNDKVIINKYEDLIDKVIEVNNHRFKVVGIIDTFEQVDNFIAESQTVSGNDQWALSNKVFQYYQNSFDLILFSNKGFLNSYLGSSVDINTNQIGSFNLTDVDLHNIYINKINQISSLNSSNVIKFKNVTNINSNESIVLTLNQLLNYDNNVFQEINDYLEDYVSTINYSTIVDILTDYGYYYESGDPVIDELENRKNLFENFYSLNVWNELLLPNTVLNRVNAIKQAATNYFNTVNPKEYDFNFNDYYQDKEINLKVSLTGVYISDDFTQYDYKDTVYLSDFIFNKLEIEEEGPYVKAISFNTSNKELTNALIDYHFDDKTKTSYKLNNEVTNSLEFINDLIEDLSNAFVYIGIGFAVFASLMLLNFISISVTNKKQEIGILRAIGARGKDVLGIFTKESMIIAIINYTVALVMTINAVIYINIMFKNTFNMPIKILSFGIRQIILMLAVDLVVAFLSSALPVIKTSRKRPIDAIRNR